KVVDDAKSELVIPLLLKDRCIGVFDLESPELDAFTTMHVQILTLLASQAAVAIENARLYETIRTNEDRLEREIRFAQRVSAGPRARGPAKGEEELRFRRGVGAGAGAGGRPFRFPRPRAEPARRRGRRRVGQRRPRRALQRLRGRADSIADLPAAVRTGSV